MSVLKSPQRPTNASPAPVLASSSWRSPLASRGRQTTVDDLKITTFPKKLKSPSISNFVIHNEQNWVMYSTSTKNSDKTISTITILDADNADTIKEIEVSGSVFDLSWREQRLLVASSKGRAMYFKNALYPNEVVVAHPKPKKKDSFDILIAGADTKTSRNLKRVSLHPTIQNTFATMDSNTLHLWNIDNPSQPALTKLVSKHSTSETVEWSPLNPEILAVAGQKRTIKIFDIRSIKSLDASSETSTAWLKREAHRETIRCLAWHPFIPHWVASAGDDGLIRIWDLRFGGKPVVLLEDHMNSVRQVAWSPLHSEILVSGGLDRQAKIWALTVPPHYVLCTLADDHFSSAIVGVGFRGIQQETCCIASSNGKIETVNPTKPYLSPLVLSKFTKEEQEREREIEAAIYFKELDIAFARLLEISERYKKEENKSRDMAALLRLMNPKTLPNNLKASSWSTELINPSQFQEDMNLYSYYIPPNFPHQPFSGEIPANLQQKMELARLTCKIAIWVEKKKYQNILKVDQDIFMRLRVRLDAFDSKLLQGVIRLLRDVDRDKAFDWGLDLATIYGREARWVEFVPIAWELLAPTIFDSGTNVQPEKQSILMKNLGKDSISTQLKLFRSYLDLPKEHEGEPNDDDLLALTNITDDKKRVISYSATYTKASLSALLRKNMYEVFFIVASDLVGKTKGCEFESYINVLMKDTALSQFSDWIDENLRARGGDKAKAHKQALYKILTIAHTSTLMPSAPYLGDCLKRSLSALTQKEKMMYGKMGKKGKGKKAVEMARELQAELKRILGGDVQMPKVIDLSSEVKELRSLLQSTIMRLDV